jgi:hypothetical protein
MKDLTPKEKSKELVERYRYKFLAKMYCSLILWLIGGMFLREVKQEIEKL